MATQNLGRVKIVWRGTYSGSTAYVVDDAVSYEGSSYVCIQDATNKVPTNTAYWELMAQKGRDGDATIDDTTTSETSVWSSQKTNADVQASVSLLDDTVGWLGGNLLPNLLTNGTDSAGVTYTQNADGSVSMSASTITANTDRAIYDTRDTGAVEFLKGKTLVLSKGLDDATIKILINAYQDNSYVKTIVDLENGTVSQPFILDYNGYNRVRITVYVKSTADLTTPKTIFPMILTKVQYALNPAYRPHHESVEDTISDVYGVMGENGAKNKLMLTLAILKANNTDGTWSGNAYTLNNVTFTVSTNNEGYVTEIDMNGTCSADWTSFWFTRGIPTKAGSYIYNGISGGEPETYRLVFEGGGINITTYGGDISVNVPSDIASTSTRLIIRKANYVADHVKAYPMLRDARDTNPNFVPFAMTNRELTEKMFVKSVNLSSVDDLNDVKETGLYNTTTAPAHTPENKTYGTLMVCYQSDASIRQMYISNSGAIYIRSYSGSPASWGSWYKFTGTVLS